MLIRGALGALSGRGERGRLNTFIFHRVLSTPDPLFPDELDCARFEQVTDWIAAWFNVLPLADAVVRLKQGSLPPRAATITFDDGYADNLLNATPILRKRGLSATFFIATGFLDGGRMWNDTVIESVRAARATEIDTDACGLRGLGVLPLQSIDEKRAALKKLIPAIKHLPGLARADAVAQVAERCGAALPDDLMLTTPQLIALRDTGMDIGAHTVTHPILARTDAVTARGEMADSRDTLAAILGQRIPLFAYPNGKPGDDYLPEHVDMAKSLGFDAAVSTTWGVSNRTTDPFQLRRFTPWDNTRMRFGLRLIRNMWTSAS